MPAPTGAHTTLWYLWEDGFGVTPTDTNNKPFGGNATLSQFEGSNNAVDIFQPNSREMAQLIAQHFDGAFSVDFEVTNPWWLQAVIAAATSVDNGDGTHTHTFDGDVPLPMEIHAGYESRANDGNGPAERVLTGCVVTTASITTSVEDTASATLSGAYVSESWDDSVTELTPQPTLEHDVMTFVDASLQLDSSTLSLVQDASVEINNNTDIIRELGTRIGVDYSPKARVPTVEYTKIREDNSEVEDMYGSEAASAIQETVDSDKPMSYQLDNGKAAGSGMNAMQLDMDGAFPESLTTENMGNPQEDLQEAINRRLRTVSAEATNEVAEAL